jgi:hypothetical protein
VRVGTRSLGSCDCFIDFANACSNPTSDEIGVVVFDFDDAKAFVAPKDETSRRVLKSVADFLKQ